MRIEKNKVVSIDYTLSDPQGRVLDSSQPGRPLSYLHGTGNIIPGLEAALDGKSAGDQIQATIPPDQAYGARNDALVQAVPRDRFAAVSRISPGMQFQADTPQGNRVVTVVSADDQTVTIDANHPLAGATLHFDVKVAGVRDPSPEELAHGHVHEPGGHHH